MTLEVTISVTVTPELVAIWEHTARRRRSDRKPVPAQLDAAIDVAQVALARARAGLVSDVAHFVDPDPVIEARSMPMRRVSIAEAARLADRSHATLGRWCNQGRLVRAEQHSGGWIVDLNEVRTVIEEMRK